MQQEIKLEQPLDLEKARKYLKELFETETLEEFAHRAYRTSNGEIGFPPEDKTNPA